MRFVGFMLMLLVAAPVVAGEEIEDFEQLDLEELLDVVFTAAKHEQDIAESPSAITVISREDIENTHCTDVPCLLRQVPEVDVQRVAPMWTSVGARALTNEYGDRALVLIDGREANLELMGITLWQALTVHMEDIERIEVIRGPGSALYGANAHSVVISITSSRSARDSVKVFVGGGEHDTLSMNVRMDKLLGPWRLQVSAGAETGGHWRIQDAREREFGRLRLMVERKTESSTSTLQLGLMNPAGEVFVMLVPGQVFDNTATGFRLAHSTDWIRAQVSGVIFDVNMYLDLPFFYGGNRLADMYEPLEFLGTSVDSLVEVTWSPLKDNLLIAGANYRWSAFISEHNDPEENYEHRVGVFLHDEQRLFEDLVLTGGIRCDINTITPVAVSPRLAVVWRFARGQVGRLAFGQAFRKPSFFNTSAHIVNIRAEPGFGEFEDIFRRGLGNPDLENESITTLEAGYNGRFLEDRLVVEADVFYNRYRNTINLYLNFASNMGLPDLARSEAEFRNTGLDADSLGGSISVTYRIKKLLRLSFNYTVRRSWYVTGSGDLHGGRDVSKGDRVAWEPAHLANLSAHYISKTGFRGGLALNGRSSFSMEEYQEGNPFLDLVLLDNPPLLTVGGFLSYRIPLGSAWTEIGVRAYNLLGVGFRDRPAVFRHDGVRVGGELIGRRLFFFVRGSI